MPLTAMIFVGQGTIAECADIDRQAWNAAFRASGLRWEWSWDTFAELMRPGGSRRLVERYAEFLDVSVDVEALNLAHARAVQARLAEELPLRHGVDLALAWAAKQGLSLGIVSRAETAQLHALLAATARARGGIAFDIALSRSDMPRPMPHPDGIEAALEALNCHPSQAIAIADTPASAAAAMDAGLETVAFPGLLAEDLSFPFGVHPATRLSPELLARFSGASAQAAE